MIANPLTETVTNDVFASHARSLGHVDCTLLRCIYFCEHLCYMNCFEM